MQNSINKTMYGIQNIYYIKLYDSKEIEKNKIVLYQDGKEIATIDNNSKIQFSQEYIYQM